MDSVRPRWRELANRLRDFARRTGVPLVTLPGKRNDGHAFWRNTSFPTVALEVPIKHMHRAIETIARKDVELMRWFLKGFLQANRD